MKRYVLILYGLLYCMDVFCQCPPSILKVETPDCKAPGNLDVAALSCDSLKITWQGSKGQSYLVKATVNDSTQQKKSWLTISKYSCNANNACMATLHCNGGQDISWSVQSVCTIHNALVYSNVMRGKNYTMPFCSANSDKGIPGDLKTFSTGNIKIYPNPAFNYIMVDAGRSLDKIVYSITDASGKKIYEGIFASSTGAVKINVSSIAPGTYTLEINNNGDITRAKFIKLNK